MGLFHHSIFKKMPLRKDTILAFFMAVNNEVGSVQPIEEIVKF